MDFEPYIFFNGNCEQALNFYKGLFGGEIVSIMRWKDAPGDMQGDPSLGDKIMHAQFKAPSIQLQGADARPTTEYGMSRISLSLGITDPDQAKRIFDGLGKGGSIETPFEKQFWGAMFGMLTDRFGVDWMVNCQLEPMPARN